MTIKITSQLIKQVIKYLKLIKQVIKYIKC